MTPIEQRLAKRIHNQRARLRQMEMFESWQREGRVWSRSEWFTMACKLLKENRELRDRLGIEQSFDQRAALVDHK